MLYKTEFTLIALGGIGGCVVAFLIFFGISYLINRRLDTIGGRRSVTAQKTERLFWKISKWTMQFITFVSVGFFFVALAGFTQTPIIVLWILFFLVWGFLFLHKFRSISLPPGQFIQLQNIFEEEDDFAIDDDINLTSIPRKRHSIREKIQHYIFTCKLAIRNKKVQFLVGIACILFVSCTIIFLSSCMCVVLHPYELTTEFTRRFSKPYCEPNAICNVYFTLGSQPNEFIANFQMAELPDGAPFVLFDTTSHPSSADWLSSRSTKVDADNFKMTSTDEIERYVSWADLVTLQANTTYYVVAGYTKGNDIILSKEYKIRTLPPSGPFSFISGGDMSLDEAGHKLMRLAAAKDPYFAMIGGDIAYDNGFAACYYRWDQWFSNWEQIMITKDNYSIPIVAAIGNHEAGGFFSQSGNDPYFSSYFPQQTGLRQVSPRSRLTYHSHWLTKSLVVLVLDTDIVARMEGDQAAWLEAELQKAANVSLKLSLYHGNLYPALPETSSIAAHGKQFWAPIFDKYSLTLSFENHCHTYKRTIPIRNDKPADDGVVYLGDGAWGVDPRAPSSFWYTAIVAQKQHVFHVSVDTDYIKADAFGLDDAIFDSYEKQIVQK